MKKIITLILSLIIFNSCDDRELEAISNFGFEIETEFNTEIDLKTDNQILIKIDPQKIIPNTVYEVSYKVLEGDITLKNNLIEAFPQNTKIEIKNLKDLKTNLYVYANEIGSAKIELEITDNFNGFYNTIIDFNVNISEISNSFNTLNPEIFIGEKANLIHVFDELKPIPESSFKVVYKIVEGRGEIKSNNEKIILNEEIKREPGEYKLEYVPSEIGNHKIEVIVIDRLNNKYPKIININVKKNKFKITLEEPIKKEYYKTDNSFPLNIKLIQESSANIEYEIYFESDNSDIVEIRKGISIVQLDKKEEILNNVTKNYKLNPINTGNYKLDIKVKDSFGQIEILPIEIKIIPNDFKLIVTPKKNIINRGDKVRFLVDIKHNGPNSSFINYQIKYSTSLKTKAVLNLTKPINAYPPETFVNTVSKGLKDNHEFEIELEAVEKGTNEVSITILASNGVEKVYTFSYDVQNIPFITNVRTWRNSIEVKNILGLIKTYRSDYYVFITYNRSEYPDVTKIEFSVPGKISPKIIDINPEELDDFIKILSGEETFDTRNGPINLDIRDIGFSQYKIKIFTRNGEVSNTYTGFFSPEKDDNI